MPDNNDIVFNQYSVDFLALMDILIGRFFGDGGVSTNFGADTLSTWSPSMVFHVLSDIWSVLVVLSWLVSSILVFGIVYAYIRHNQLGDNGSAILKQQEEAFAKINKKDVKNLRWQDVLAHIDSDRPNDWKLAIIEADIILDELLNSLGYAGTSIGEKLKSASPTTFTTINQAWRAHNVRNRIAHEGGDFELSKREAQETITEYKMVFEEFEFV